MQWHLQLIIGLFNDECSMHQNYFIHFHAHSIVTCIYVFDIQVPDETLIDRCIGRRLDPLTGKIYHLKSLIPESEEIKARLVTRPDDTEEKVYSCIIIFMAPFVYLSQPIFNRLKKDNESRKFFDTFLGVMHTHFSQFSVNSHQIGVYECYTRIHVISLRYRCIMKNEEYVTQVSDITNHRVYIIGVCNP